jgi:predicted lipoprotein with Yx(FWY)xxD motif
MPSTVETTLHSKIRQSLIASSRRSRWLVGGSLAALVLIATACGSSGATTTTTKAGSLTRTASAVTVKTAHSSTLGTILVDQSGLTLYRYTPDGTGKTTCTGACAAAWPPLTLPSGATHAAAGAGVTASALGTITRPGGVLQVTFQGMPLYRFAGDKKVGQTSGQGVAGTWFVVSPTTTSTPAAPAASASNSPSTTTTAPMAAPATRSGGVTAATSPPATSPPATSPPATSPPATSPPPTSPPPTSPPSTQPPVTTTTSGGGYGY